MAGQSNGHARATLYMIHQFHLDKEYWDVQLQVGSRLFKCLRVLLATHSEYFDTEFFGSKNLKESNPTPDNPITLNGPGAAAFEDILHFMYSGEVLVNDSNVHRLLCWHHFLGLRTDDVKNECYEFLVDRIKQTGPIPDAIALFWLARTKSEESIALHMSHHIIKHLYHFSEDALLMETPYEYLQWLLTRGSDYLNLLPGSADALVPIIHKWVRHNREERSQYRLELLIQSIHHSKVSSGMLSKMLTLDVDDIGGNARLCATISLKVRNISRLPSRWTVYSEFRFVSNLPRRTCIERESEDVNFYLECKKAPWNFNMRAIFSIVSSEEDIQLDTGHDIVLISPDPRRWKTDKPYKTDYLFNPKNGFIKDDDSMTLDVLLRAGPPIFM